MKNKILTLFIASALSVGYAQNIVEVKVVNTTPPSNPTYNNHDDKNNSIFVFKNGSKDGSAVYGKTGPYTNFKGSNLEVYLEKNVNIEISGDSTQILTYLEMDEGSSMSLTNSKIGLRLQNGVSTIAGNITLNCFKRSAAVNFGADNYAFSVYSNQNGVASVNFVGNSNLTQLGINGAYNDYTRSINRINGTLTVQTQGKLSFDDYMYINTSTINLYSSNSLISGAGVEKNDANVAAGLKNATSQADSTFYIVGSSANSNPTLPAVVTINSSTANEMGTINAYSGSTLELNSENASEAFKINNLNIFTLDATTEGATTMNEALSLTLELKFLEENGSNLFIGNLDELLDLGQVNVKIFDFKQGSYVEGTLGENYFINNGGWISTTAVPEPAEWAMIFGAIALSFVAYRRRK